MPCVKQNNIREVDFVAKNMVSARLYVTESLDPHNDDVLLSSIDATFIVSWASPILGREQMTCCQVVVATSDLSRTNKNTAPERC